MKNLFSWLENRTTGAVGLGKGLLHESIPGGAKWRYSWVTLLVFTYLLQAITGFFIWMFYSPSTQTAWESIYYLQNQVPGGWFLRALHHYTAQVVVVLTALHLLQMIVYKAYQAPREINFWLVLLLLPLVMGLSVTGWLLPYDQRGFWASRVPLNILSIIPMIGPKIARVLIGGKEFGHHTLTHFLALHAGLLPVLTFIVLFAHYLLYRRHGLSQVPAKTEVKTASYFPDQLLRDAVVCLALVAVLLFIILRGAMGGAGSPMGVEIGAPADPTEPYAAARPEWFMLFLFQLLKFFPGGTEIIGAVIIPTIVMGVIAAMPFIGKWNYGHRFNLLFTGALVICATILTGLAFKQDGADAGFLNAKREARIAGERTQV
ncbi:MAG: menaquinol-cytochrome reductase, partial [Verrucomicrobiales bacterium]|nr:menaquinol-cytochrome reductase [Verrucomicrobiales bacterium]